MGTSAPWIGDTLAALAARPAIGYAPQAAVAAEPTAIAAMALVAHGRVDAARPAAEALVKLQADSGTVGVRSGEPGPGWPTSLAIVVWQAVDAERYQNQVARGVNWLLANRGMPIEQSPEFGHNTTLVGWSYAEQTHSWVEPTALAVLAMKAAGKGDSAATREAAALLVDRQLPGGGLNYGNTIVLGQIVRAHVQPTGIALLALGQRTNGGPAPASAGWSHPTERVAKSVAWLLRSIGPTTTPLSLGWALLGLRAQGGLPEQADEWLEKAARRACGSLKDGQAGRLSYGGFKHALLALAAKGWPL